MENLNSVWNVIGAFFDALPSEVVMVCTFAFIGFFVLGLLGWLK